MDWIRRYFRNLGPREDDRPRNTGVDLVKEVDDAKLEMASTLVLGLEQRARRLKFADHCARVMRIAHHLADRLGVAPAHTKALLRAAQLHEIGMIAVPPALIEAPRPLTSEELARVRAQARIGAEIVRATQGQLIAELIEHQYADLPELTRRFHPKSPEYLLAGILRVADLYDTTTRPRPYQRDLTPAMRQEILRSGIGARFHPDAVDVLLQIDAG
jgi:response regulator RpfG family c-di-GMP phosphodiesterase